MSDKYIVRYYARSSGKAVEQLNQMMVNYIPKHLGKVIKFEVVPCEEITKLKKALEIANEAIGFYANKSSYCTTKNVRPRIPWEKRLVVASDVDEDCAGFPVAGLRAREAQKQIKEIMES